MANNDAKPHGLNYDLVVAGLKAGYSQTWLAERLGISRQRVHQIKRDAEAKELLPNNATATIYARYYNYDRVVQYVLMTGNHNRKQVGEALGLSDKWVGKCIIRAYEEGDL